MLPAQAMMCMESRVTSMPADAPGSESAGQ